MSEIVTITGATGALGRRAVARLVAAGHEVRGVTRSPGGRAVLEALGARAVEADVYDPRSLARAFAGSDAVVNLLTRIPPVERMLLPGAWRENERLRGEASRAVALAAGRVGAERLVQESFAYLYADGGARWLDEDAPLDPAGPPASALRAERNAREAFDGRVVVLRFGAFMAPDSDQTRLQLAQARRGLSPVPAPREAYVPTLWLDDAGSAVAAALRAPAGTYNVVDDDPPTRAQIDAALAALVGRARLRSPLAPATRVVGTLRVLARSLRLSNRRLREATGWAPEVRAGLDGWRLVDAAVAAA